MLELFVKLLKEGLRIPRLVEIGDETRSWAQKNTKGLNRVPNSILDQNLRSNEFSPHFVPVNVIFCAWKLHSRKILLFSFLVV